ncbi:MAG: ABC transporter permease [Bacteroidales bacterium]|jgi:ABC-type lipoprotein release transport system permease subunit|nr:ABC transporter permease [Bacteroidales bacterium]
MSYLRMAWRNLWRNKRRTMITVASIFFGVLLATIMASMQDGTYGNMIDMMVRLSSGYLQVQYPDYAGDKTVNNVFAPADDLVERLETSASVTTVASRFESFALISSGMNTRGGAVIGFEPAKDKETSNLGHWVSEGSMLNTGDKGVLVASNIARYLGLGINDTIILISQGYRGVTAAGQYPIKGILTFSTPQMNNLGVFMDVAIAQELFSAEGMITSLVIMTDGYDAVAPALREVNAIAGDSLSVLTWQELNPEIVQFIESDKAGGVVMLFILYIVIGFGIFGTIIMMLAERRRELGVMVAVGMHKSKLATVLFLETMLIGLTGVVVGFAVSIPVILTLVGNPIELPGEVREAYLQYGFEPFLFFGTAPWIFVNQVVTVFAITTAVAFYPVVKIRKLVVAKALRA